MSAPERSLTQRMTALDKANRIRVARAELKRLLKADTDLVWVRRIIRNPPRAAHALARELEPRLGWRPPGDWLESMPVVAVLLACPAIGGVKARRLMRDAWGNLTTTTRRIGGMTAHHREALTATLDDYANRRIDYRETGKRAA